MKARNGISLGRARRWHTPIIVLAAVVLSVPAPAHADNRRLNNGVVANVYTVQKQAGCATDIKVNPKLRLAAQWHTDDVLNNPELDGDVGSDGSTTTLRARNAGYLGVAAEAVAINPALAISGLEVINQWFARPDLHAIMADCANVDIGVWSANSPSRSVVVAVYGQGDRVP